MRFPKPICWVDTESTGVNSWHGAAPFGTALLWGDLASPEYKYFEWKVDPYTRKVYPDKADVDFLRSKIENPSWTKGLFNAKFDLFRMLPKVGIRSKGRFEDVYLAAKVCNNLELTYGLKDLARRKCGYPVEDIDELSVWAQKLRPKAQEKGWKIAEKGPIFGDQPYKADYWLCQYVDDLMPQLSQTERDHVRMLVGTYCIGDVMRTALLWEEWYQAELDSDTHYRTKYEEELEVLLETVRMENRGITLYASRCDEQRQVCKVKADQALVRMINVAGPRFNPGSTTKQLPEVLYGKLGLECIKKTPTGGPSTDWKALAPHINHPFVKDIFTWRTNSRGNQFFDQYEALRTRDHIYPSEQDLYCIHTSLNQIEAITNRFSSNSPNLQQVPKNSSFKPGSEGIPARFVFGPRPGYVWWKADFSQQELRIFADFAQVKAIIKAVEEGRDPNTENANLMFGGKGNPAALEAAALALELGSNEPSIDSIKQVWKDLKWSAELAKSGVWSSAALTAADLWLQAFNYEIVKAEGTIGTKSSRNRAKQILLARQYGGSVTAVIDMLFCSLEQANKHLQALKRAYPEVDPFIKSFIQTAREQEYIINPYGRKLNVRPDAAYKAVNYMVQGSAADMIKLALRKAGWFLRSLGLDIHLILTVHDEIIFEAKKEHAYLWVAQELKRIMEDTEGRFKIKMETDWTLCEKCWAEGVPMKI